MRDEWWQRGVIYHVYLRSFRDTNGDGIGDLAGLTLQLEYLAWLGVDAVWISPFYPSPQRDFGYDVAGYTDVDPLFGSLDDFDELVARAHRLELRVLLDFVPNHTSDAHPWFEAACSSPSGPLRNWYVWREAGPGGQPPNNWRAVTGGSAWVWHEPTAQYYLASFLPFQPDLNWREPQVEDAMLAVMRFWLDRGVDGFRVDMVDYLLKDNQFRDEPVDASGRYEPGQARYHLNQPDLLRLLARMRAVTDAYPGAVLLGEVEYHLTPKQLASYYGSQSTGGLLHLPFNFGLMFLPWTASAIQEFISAYEAVLPYGAWPNWMLGSHDMSRSATRLGPLRAPAALVLLLTLRGTPILYYGDELAMRDVPVPDEQAHDPWAAIQPGAGRDPARTPMRWDPSVNAGFTSARCTPWLPVRSVDDPGDDELDVTSQSGDPSSTLQLVRELLRVRRAEPALATGDYGPWPAPEGVLAFTRDQGDDRLLIAINLTGSRAAVRLPDRDSGGDALPANQGFAGSRIAVSTNMRRRDEAVSSSLSLAPNEACVLSLRHP